MGMSWEQLVQWAQENQPLQEKSGVEHTMWHIVAIWEGWLGEPNSIDLWISLLNEVLSYEKYPARHFYAVESLLAATEQNFATQVSLLAQICFEQKREGDFLEVVNRLQGTTKLPVFQFVFGWGLFNQGRYSECIRFVSQLEPKTSDIYILLGQCYQDLEQHELALVQYEIACQVSPDQVLPYFQAARAAYSLGAYEKAWSFGCLAFKLEPNNPEVHVLNYYILSDYREKLCSPVAGKLWHCAKKAPQTFFSDSVLGIVFLRLTLHWGNKNDWQDLQNPLKLYYKPSHEDVCEVVRISNQLFERSFEKFAKTLVETCLARTLPGPLVQP